MKQKKLFLLVLSLVMGIVLLCSCETPCIHNWEKYQTISVATCTEKGSVKQKCTICGEEITVEVAALGHDMQDVSSKSATCLEAGYDAYQQCSRCDYNTKQVEIPALNHDFGEEWEKNETSHWHECTREGCNGKKDEAEHKDGDNNHLCDTCSKELSKCKDEDNNHLCDTCSKELSKCKDEDNNHLCDTCSKELSKCEDEDNNHLCDTCSKELSKCEDEDNNHLCDTCSKELSKCTGGTATCTSKAICSICKNEYGEYGKHVYNEETWLYNESSHYQKCENCDNLNDATNHTYVDGVCSTCKVKDTFGTIGIGYKYNSTQNAYSVSTYTGTEKDIKIPYFYDDGTNGLLPVYLIESTAFRYNTNITSVVIPNSVIQISGGSFRGCINIESLTIPFVGAKAGVTSSDTYQYPFGYIFGTSKYEGSVTVQQEYVMSSTSSTSAEYYYIPSSLRNVTVTGGNILNGAFFNCEMIEKITLLTDISVIYDRAFYGCEQLLSINIPSSVTNIRYRAFYNCPRLYEIINDSSLEFVLGSENEYGGVAKNAIVISKDGTSKIKTDENGYMYFEGETENILIYAPKTQSSFVLPEQIGGKNYSLLGTFYYRKDLTSVVIPNTVKTIGKGSFQLCTSLTSVVIPSTVTIIGDHAFSHCTSLQSVIFEENSNLEIISEDAFRNCTSLTKIIIPAITVKNKAFYSCTNLSEVIFLDSVKTISEEAFGSCTFILSVTLGTSVQSIGKNAFKESSRLFQVINNSKLNLTIGADTYGYIAKNAKIIVTDGSGSKIIKDADGYTYLSYEGESLLISYEGTATDLVLPEKLDGKNYIIGTNAFKGNTNLQKVTLPSTLLYIDSYAFRECTSLKSIIIPASVTSLGVSSFKDCTSLESVEFSKNGSLTKISSNCFENCTELTSVIIPNTVITIGGSAFKGCTKLTSVVFEKTSQVTTIGDSAFSGCPITSITIPKSVTTIDSIAFYKCTKLSSITFEEGINLKSISATCFGQCTSLTTFAMPDSVTAINWNAFINCTNLTSVIFGVNSKLSVIGETAFSSCSKLESIVLPSSLKSIQKKAFYNCTKLTSIVIPESVTSIGSQAFLNWRSTQTINFVASEEVISAWSDSSWKNSCYAVINYSYTIDSGE